jgi:hypothetical protein
MPPATSCRHPGCQRRPKRDDPHHWGNPDAGQHQRADPVQAGQVLPATSRGRTVASSALACAADRSFFAPPGISSSSNRSSWEIMRAWSSPDARCRSERAMSWLAYPAGLLAAWRGDEGAAEEYAQRLAWWADLVDERPRTAMAGHVRAVVAAARQDWAAGLEHTCRSQRVLDELGIAHPGAVPVLALAIQLASLAGAGGLMADLAGRLIEQAASVRSPWSSAHSLAARGFSALTKAQPDAFALLLEAQHLLCRLGYRLDAARASCGVMAAAVRGGQRAQALAVGQESLAFLSE